MQHLIVRFGWCGEPFCRTFFAEDQASAEDICFDIYRKAFNREPSSFFVANIFLGGFFSGHRRGGRDFFISMENCDCDQHEAHEHFENFVFPSEIVINGKLSD